MRSDTSFRDYILEQLVDVPSLRCRAMFNSYGLYVGKKFFGIIHDGSLYFKTHAHTREDYISYGMKPFAPSEKQILKNYYEVPGDVIENPEELKEWVLKSAQGYYPLRENKDS